MIPSQRESREREERGWVTGHWGLRTSLWVSDPTMAPKRGLALFLCLPFQAGKMGLRGEARRGIPPRRPNSGLVAGAAILNILRTPNSRKGGLCLDLQLSCALAPAKASFISPQNSL